MRGDIQNIYGGPSLSDGYLAFLTEELKPFIDRTYRTLTGPPTPSCPAPAWAG
jgi:predicted alpha/beta superfamily hydrolase